MKQCHIGTKKILEKFKIQIAFLNVVIILQTQSYQYHFPCAQSCSKQIFVKNLIFIGS